MQLSKNWSKIILVELGLRKDDIFYMQLHYKNMTSLFAATYSHTTEVCVCTSVFTAVLQL